KLVADILKIPEREVLVASTGVIGTPLPMAKLKKAIPLLAENVGSANLLDVAKAIMTTDTFPKISQHSIRIGRKICHIEGIAKGAGMIAPDMATMLAFILTDALLEPEFAKRVLKECIDETFNSISVDGDTSTNDTVFLLANGASSAQPIDATSGASKRFRNSLLKVCDELATMIVRDGEGASKRLVINVRGAKTPKEAQMISRTVANSMLVKTGFSGTEPNWGRVVAAVGRSGVPIREDSISLAINGVRIFSKGSPTGKEDVLRERLSGDTVEILIDLNRGAVNSTFQTSDLTEEYVRINADYLT
ncbi:MAG: bifunctional glutamate N-acetyltransferase/amino-acid acetyltransferase ArgJ, partial [Nitrospirae bacterium]